MRRQRHIYVLVIKERLLYIARAFNGILPVGVLLAPELVHIICHTLLHTLPQCSSLACACAERACQFHYGVLFLIRVGGGECAGVRCPLVYCPNPVTLEYECCARCPGHPQWPALITE